MVEQMTHMFFHMISKHMYMISCLDVSSKSSICCLVFWGQFYLCCCLVHVLAMLILKFAGTAAGWLKLLCSILHSRNLQWDGNVNESLSCLSFQTTD
jgi:hypothetical protein